MDIVGEMINDPRFEAKFMSMLEKYHTGKVKEDLTATISEAEAMTILGCKGKSTMLKYREMGLPYNPGKPITYVKELVFEFRNKELLKNRRM